MVDQYTYHGKVFCFSGFYLYISTHVMQFSYKDSEYDCVIQKQNYDFHVLTSKIYFVLNSSSHL